MQPRFADRTAWDVSESALATAIREAGANGRYLHDLTLSNPTQCGFSYDPEWVLASLVDTKALTYDPDPRGMRSAREAVTAFYADHHAAVTPDDLILTTSTSEGYAYLFRLLCNSRDEILIAQPSYPLFDFLADIEDVRLKPYPLFYDYGWWIDFDVLEQSIGPRTRAIIVVHPNNPTGHATRKDERTRLEDLCARHGLALIVDEVFLDYPLEAKEPLETFASGSHPALTFVLSGMSKVAGLPQMKVGWIAALGPEKPCQAALARLEVIADTFLSMNAPAQLALPHWIEGRSTIQRQILARLRTNLAGAKAAGLELLLVEAGWSAIVRLHERRPSEDLSINLVQRSGVITHPGSFYGMAERGRIVISLLGPPTEFAAGAYLLSLAKNRNS